MSDRPTFWFYLPAPLTGNTPIEFVVQDAINRYVYNTRIAAAKTQAGLMQLSLPTTAQPLEVGKSYTWTLSIYCDPAKPSQAVFVNSLIQRMAARPDLQRRLSTSAPLEQVKLYVMNGIWYEALNGLAPLYRANPQERQMAAAWASLLQHPLNGA